jgi:hypothetical protein
MTQTIATIDMITKESQLVLHESASFIPTVNRSFDDSFGKVGAKIGDSLRVRLPARQTVRTGRAMSVQDIEDESVTLTCATQKGVDLRFTSAEMALGIDYLSDRYIRPAMKLLVSEIEEDALSMTKNVANLSGSAGTAMSDLSALGNARAKLNGQACPKSDRSIILDSIQMSGVVDGLKGLYQDSAQIKEAMREGFYARLAMGDLYENERIWTLPNSADVAGTLDTYTITNGDADLTVTGLSAAPVEGMVFTIAGVYACHPETKQNLGYLKQWVVDSGSSTTDLNVQGSIYISGPKQNCVATGVSTTAAIAFVGSASTNYRQGLMYHKDAFAFVTADLPLMGGSEKCVRMVQDGISLRVWQGPDIVNDELLTRIDILYGYKAIRPEWACRLIGAAAA